MINIKALLIFLTGENLWALIKKYKEKIAERRASGDSLIRDLTDGDEYKKLYEEGGFLSCPNNVSFLVNTGIAS